jgi:hypothetical protein
MTETDGLIRRRSDGVALLAWCSWAGGTGAITGGETVASEGAVQEGGFASAGWGYGEAGL